MIRSHKQNQITKLFLTCVGGMAACHRMAVELTPLSFTVSNILLVKFHFYAFMLLKIVCQTSSASDVTRVWFFCIIFVSREHSASRTLKIQFPKVSPKQSPKRSLHNINKDLVHDQTCSTFAKQSTLFAYFTSRNLGQSCFRLLCFKYN